MQTIHRSTASRNPNRDEADALSRRVQALWTLAPNAAWHEREPLLVQLGQLGSDIERLRIRSTTDILQPHDVGDLRDCAERLADVEHQWAHGGQTERPHLSAQLART